jgi:hypothetical protein
MQSLEVCSAPLRQALRARLATADVRSSIAWEDGAVGVMWLRRWYRGGTPRGRPHALFQGNPSSFATGVY